MAIICYNGPMKDELLKHLKEAAATLGIDPASVALSTPKIRITVIFRPMLP